MKKKRRKKATDSGNDPALSVDARRLNFESLEPRRLLAVTPSLSGDEVSFASDGEDVYVRSVAGLLSWSSDGVSFSSDLNGDGTGGDLRTDQQNAITISAEGSSLSNGNIFNPKTGDLILQDIWVVGADLNVKAFNIKVDAAATVSTRDVATDLVMGSSIGDSGNLLLEGPSITLEQGSSLLTHVEDNSAYRAGGITLKAEYTGNNGQTTIPFFDRTDADTNIRLIGATIRGGAVVVTADSDSADLFGDDSDLKGVGGFLAGQGESILSAFGSVSVLGGVAVSTADAAILVSGGSIEADSLTMSSDAATDAKVKTVTIYVAIAFGRSAPHASIDIQDGASITTTDFVSVKSTADSALSVAATQELLGASTASEKYNLTVAVAVADIHSSSTISSDSTVIAGGEVEVAADVAKEHEVESAAEAYLDGTLGIAIGVNVDDTTVAAQVDGNITAGSNLTVDASVETEAYKVIANSQTGVGSGVAERVKDAIAEKASGALLKGLYSGVLNRIGIRGKHQLEDQSSNEKWGLSASFAWNEITNEVTARIGPDAVVDVDGDVSINAELTETPQAKTSSSVKSSSNKDVHREIGLSGAISVGWFNNTAEAYIGKNAMVTANDVFIHSSLESPYEFKWFVNQNLNDPNTYIGKIKPDLGLTLGLFTTFGKSRASGDKVSVAGTILVSRFDNTSNAYIDDGAKVTANGDLSVIAVAENDSVNFGGPYMDNMVDARGLLRGSATEGKGAGGTFQWYEVTNHVRAEIKQDAVVSADSVLVFADNDVRNITIGVQGGSADKFGFSGVSAVIATINHTVARIDDTAVVLAGSGQISIPKDFDTISDDENSLFSSINVFGPNVRFVDENTEQVRTTVDVISNTITLPYKHGLASGDAVVYSNGGGTDIGGLADRGTYFVVADPNDDYNLQLTTTYELAIASDASSHVINLNLDDTTGAAHILFPGFNPLAAGIVDVTTGDIDLGDDYGFFAGQPVRYSNGGGASIGGLQHGTTYYVIPAQPDENGNVATTVRLATTASNARDDTSITLSLTDVTGRGHSLLPIPYTDAQVEDVPNVLDSNNNGVIDLSDEHVAGFDSDTYITDFSLAVIAGDESEIFNGAGGVAVGRNVGVGLALAVDLIDRTTEATVGGHQVMLGGRHDVSLDNDEFAPGVGIDSGGSFNLGYSHGFSTGDEVVYTAGGDYVISGLVDGEIYVVRAVDASTIQLARSKQEALHAASTFFTPSSSTVNSNFAVIDLGYTHQFQIGDAVEYFVHDGAAIDNLTDGQTYYVIPISATKIALTDSVESAMDTFHTIFIPRDVVNSSHQLVFTSGHGFVQDQLVQYGNGGGTSIGGLTDENVYKIDVVDENHVSLVDPGTNAQVSLDASTSSGHFHTLQPGFDAQSSVVAASDRLDSRVEQINLGYDHNLITQDPVRYTSLGGNPVGGLTDGHQYYAVVFDADSVGLAATEDDAIKARQRSFIPADGSADLASGSLKDLDADQQFETIELYADHGYQTGDRVVYSANGGTAIGGLVDGQVYYVIVPMVDNAPATAEIQLAASPSDATAGTAINLDPSGLASDEPHHYVRGDTLIGLDKMAAATTGHFVVRDNRLAIDTTSSSGMSHSFRLRVDPGGTMRDTHGVGRLFSPQSNGVIDTSDNTVNLGYTHGFVTGQAVLYTAGGGDPIGGLHQGTPYYVVVVNSTTIKLAESFNEATSESPEVLPLDSATASGTSHGIASVTRPIPVVDSTADTILAPLHGLKTGDTVVYENSGGASIGPLVSGATYFVVSITRDTFALSDSDPTSGPDNETRIDLIDLDASSATGSAHSLRRLGQNTGRIQAGGHAALVANNDGQIISVSLAAAVVTDHRVGRHYSRSVMQTDGKPAQTGAAAAGDFAVSVVHDTTKAAIDGADFTVDTGNLTLRSINDSHVVTAGGAFAIATSSQTSEGLAGSFVVNVVDNTTTASIANSLTTVASGNLVLDADNTNTLVGVALGGTGVSGVLGVAGSITVNLVLADTIALIDDQSDVQVSDPANTGAGQVTLSATNENKITGVAGRSPLWRPGRVGRLGRDKVSGLRLPST